MKKTAIRTGAAAAEAALILPILIVVTLGGIDVAQYINHGQIISNASREAARIASRHSTESEDEVRSAVEEYIGDWYAGYGSDSEAQVQESGESGSLQVSVKTGSGQTISAGDLTRVDSGESLRVEVSFDFSEVRWLPGPTYWNNNVKSVTTYCRRE